MQKSEENRPAEKVYLALLQASNSTGNLSIHESCTRYNHFGHGDAHIARGDVGLDGIPVKMLLTAALWLLRMYSYCCARPPRNLHCASRNKVASIALFLLARLSIRSGVRNAFSAATRADLKSPFSLR